jgi:glutathione synthase/RimK-type ligase-like ATP-grasp enzyme
MLLWANSAKHCARHFVIIGNPENRRIGMFQSALARLNLPAASIVSYEDLLAGRANLSDYVKSGAIVRIESPGENFAVEKALLMVGAQAAEDEKSAGISRQQANELSFDKGRILYPRQWYLGFCQTLKMIENQLADCPEHQLMNCPADIGLMFDKLRCQELLANNGIPVPKNFGSISSFDELIDRIEQTKCRRVFIKLAHGSSASGVVAYRTNGRDHQAITSVEMMRKDGQLRLYNSLKIRCYRNLSDIAELIDELARHRAHAEQWLPKANLDGRVFDLRVVVIAGKAGHEVIRLSRSPLTNLHLANARGDIAATRARLGEKIWQALIASCEQATRSFFRSLYAGIDIMITSDLRRHAILEMNAFGDLLPNILKDGLDTYSTQILAMLARTRQINA